MERWQQICVIQQLSLWQDAASNSIDPLNTCLIDGLFGSGGSILADLGSFGFRVLQRCLTAQLKWAPPNEDKNMQSKLLQLI